MRRKKRLCGLCPSSAWLMNKKLPVMAISDASPTAWLVNQGLWPHRYCWPTPKKCKEYSRLPLVSSAYWMNSGSRRLYHCAML